MCSVQRHLKEDLKFEKISFFDSADFADFRRTLDARMKDLNNKGVGAVKKQAEPVTEEIESKLWGMGIFSLTDSTGLHQALYFYLCKIFGLRAANEHTNLMAEQFKLGRDDKGEYVRFLGRPNKNNQGGLKECGKLGFKDIKQYANPKNPRCFVAMMQKYLTLIPSEGAFYRRPCNPRYKGHVNFSKQKVGLHQFESLMQRIMKEAGIEGYFTGHSGKVCA